MSYPAGLINTTVASGDIVVAFSTRVLVSGYTGPLVSVRSSTGSTTDLYASLTVMNELVTNVTSAGQSVVTWAAANGGAPLYVTKWWDQVRGAARCALKCCVRKGMR